MAHWLLKSEPDVYSFADLMAEPDRRTGWDGVRNYQARNWLRDTIAVGDLVLFYHSNAEPSGVAGVAVVVEPGHPDPTAFDEDSDYYDARSQREEPTWYQVTIEGLVAIDPLIGLPELKAMPGLAGMELLRPGSRLSVQPVSEPHWNLILERAGVTVPPLPAGLKIAAASPGATTAGSKPASPAKAATPKPKTKAPSPAAAPKGAGPRKPK